MYTSNSTPRTALAALQQTVTLLPGKGSHTSASLSYSGPHDFCPFHPYFCCRASHGWESEELWQSSAHRGDGGKLLVLLLPSSQTQVQWETTMGSPFSSQHRWSLEEKAHMQKIWNPNDAQQRMRKLPQNRTEHTSQNTKLVTSGEYCLWGASFPPLLEYVTQVVHILY